MDFIRKRLKEMIKENSRAQNTQLQKQTRILDLHDEKQIQDFLALGNNGVQLKSQIRLCDCNTRPQFVICSKAGACVRIM